MKKHRFPKPFPVMLSAVLCLAGVPFGGISAQAADSVQQVNNIVLFAQFASADTDNFMADYVMDASGGIKEVRYDWIKKE